MIPIKLSIPRAEATHFSHDLTAWACVNGIDPRLTIVNETWKTTNNNSPFRYQMLVNESFFEQFPHFRQYIEQ
jgi:hypothetical protein